MQTMKLAIVFRRQITSWMFIVLFGLPGLGICAAEAPFQLGELNHFLTNSAPFFEWSRTNGQTNVLERLQKEPKNISEFPAAARLLREDGWEPERFTYILNHVIIGYKRLGMGKDPEQLLARLEESKISIKNDSKLSAAEKSLILSQLEQNQREVRQIVRDFNALPALEVSLLWLNREALHQALDGRLPVSKRELPNPSPTP
jgi:hypothetical protein